MKHSDKNYVKVKTCRSCSCDFVLSNSNQVNCDVCIGKYGKDRLRWLWKKYNMTIVEFEDIFNRQQGKCGICTVSLVLDERNENSACVDHCHSSNKIRGLLCRVCNRALGQLGDNEEGVLKVLNYLRGSNEHTS